MANSSGTVTKNYSYDAFGVETNPDLADKNPFRYAGEYYDQETKSIYLRARYYSPGLGRFGSEDPIRDGENWYLYCGNDPVNFTDPSGNKRKGEVIKKGKGSEHDIKLLQSRLNDLGYTDKNGDTLNVDGNFGDKTEYAVIQYQKDMGLNAEGLVIDLTWDSLGFTFSKTDHSQRDSGLAGESDAEVSAKARDKSLPAKERRKYQTEEKYRDLRNKQKRQNQYRKAEVYREDGVQVDPDTFLPIEAPLEGTIVLPEGNPEHDNYTSINEDPSSLPMFAPIPGGEPTPVRIPIRMPIPIRIPIPIPF